MKGCIRGCICREASSRPSPKEKAIRAQPSLIGNSNSIGAFENVEQRYKDDVVVMRLIKDVQHRLLSFGEATEQSESWEHSSGR
jgi:hypothetical protein